MQLSGLSSGAGSRSFLAPGLTGVADRAADVEMRARRLSPTTRNSQSETSLPTSHRLLCSNEMHPVSPPATGHRRGRALIRPSKVPSATEGKTGKAARSSHFACQRPQPSCKRQTPPLVCRYQRALPLTDCLGVETTHVDTSDPSSTTRCLGRGLASGSGLDRLTDGSRKATLKRRASRPAWP